MKRIILILVLIGILIFPSYCYATDISDQDIKETLNIAQEDFNNQLNDVNNNLNNIESDLSELNENVQLLVMGEYDPTKEIENKEEEKKEEKNTKNGTISDDAQYISDTISDNFTELFDTLEDYQTINIDFLSLIYLVLKESTFIIVFVLSIISGILIMSLYWKRVL